MGKITSDIGLERSKEVGKIGTIEVLAADQRTYRRGVPGRRGVRDCRWSRKSTGRDDSEKRRSL